jgi:hypothetical protein
MRTKAIQRHGFILHLLVERLRPAARRVIGRSGQEDLGRSVVTQAMVRTGLNLSMALERTKTTKSRLLFIFATTQPDIVIFLRLAARQWQRGSGYRPVRVSVKGLLLIR